MIRKHMHIWILSAIGILVCVMIYSNVYSAASQPSSNQRLDAYGINQMLSIENGSVTKGKGYIHSSMKAPEVKLKTLDGQERTINSTSGRPMVINFWSSFCNGCAMESPALAHFHEKFKDKIDFYGINATYEETKISDISSFVRDNEMNYPILLDDQKRAADLYALHATPSTFLVDEDGCIVDTFHALGPLELEAKLNRLLQVK